MHVVVVLGVKDTTGVTERMLCLCEWESRVCVFPSLFVLGLRVGLGGEGISGDGENQANIQQLGHQEKAVIKSDACSRIWCRDRDVVHVVGWKSILLPWVLNVTSASRQQVLHRNDEVRGFIVYLEEKEKENEAID